MTKDEYADMVQDQQQRWGEPVEREIPNALMTEQEREDYWDKMDEIALDERIY